MQGRHTAHVPRATCDRVYVLRCVGRRAGGGIGGALVRPLRRHQMCSAHLFGARTLADRPSPATKPFAFRGPRPMGARARAAIVPALGMPGVLLTPRAGRFSNVCPPLSGLRPCLPRVLSF